ncbi:hypothetical protein B6U60_07425 [Ligilactobacillus salivarius]|uniref:Uncharacterized protein n=1 Tax=Ligilactobacillus salivarius TaxID=1624 RepID=A0A1V9QPG3_9LACO|nr:hypothetical protein B6U60_07425 [Ligilactobacillus salivarius]OQQ85865.1 hypothetical protein B6U59_07585 [Ligilactobacillus salivarius]
MKRDSNSLFFTFSVLLTIAVVIIVGVFGIVYINKLSVITRQDTLELKSSKKTTSNGTRERDSESAKKNKSSISSSVRLKKIETDSSYSSESNVSSTSSNSSSVLVKVSGSEDSEVLKTEEVKVPADKLTAKQCGEWALAAYVKSHNITVKQWNDGAVRNVNVNNGNDGYVHIRLVNSYGNTYRYYIGASGELLDENTNRLASTVPIAIKFD